MPRDIWVTSDTHFFHENIIMYCGRPFKNAEHMNELLADNWNSVVKPGDIVYHLGDVFMGDKEGFKAFWPRLNGKKRLIVGNHDDIKFLAAGAFFEKVMMWRVFPEYKMLLTHVPIHEGSIHERIVLDGGMNVHGHIHNNPSPEGPYKCVCVEQTNYTPVHIEEVLAD